MNALIHTNYELRGSRFFVAIYDDRLEIQNPGNFPPGMTIEDFKAGVSKIRNPMIARIFREKENLEAWGSGYQRICDICEAGGYPMPEFEEVGPVIRVTFYPIGRVVKRSTRAAAVSEDHLTLRQLEIMSILEKRGGLSTKEVRAHLKEPLSERSVRDVLGQLEMIGKVKAEGATNKRKWRLKE